MPTTINKTTSTPPKTLLSPDHNACAGCPQIVAARLVVDALGPNTIIANATGCLEVVTTAYPKSSWGTPWVHSLFENAAAIASGIYAALKAQGKEKNIKVVAQGGDGATFDIGFGLISGMWERGENILYICYDNEGYMNTGAQASAATPWATNTTTTPAGSSSAGSHFIKKDMLAIALAHGLKYVAQTTSAYPDDITNKVKKAIATPGPSYLQILAPCIPGWKIEIKDTVRLAQLAVQTGIYPAVEYVNGKLAEVIKIPGQRPTVEDYLKPQGRYKHLFRDQRGKEQIAYIQKLADENVKKYKL